MIFFFHSVNIIPADSTDDKIADQRPSTPPPGKEEEYLDDLVAEFNQHADIGDAVSKFKGKVL